MGERATRCFWCRNDLESQSSNRPEKGMTMALKSAFGMLSPSGPRGRLSIFIFHRVLSQKDPLFPDEPDAITSNPF